jgi:hypothetical protein
MKLTTNPASMRTKAAITVPPLLTMALFYSREKHAHAFRARLRNRWENSLASPRASAAIPAPVSSGRFALAAGTAVAEAGAPTVAASAVASAEEEATADAGASSAGPVAAATNRIAGITAMATPDIRVVRN